MPELPEVEVSRLGITPHLIGQTVAKLTFRTPKLRWDIPKALKNIEGQVIRNISRRAKYLLIEPMWAVPLSIWGCLDRCVC